MNTDAGLAVRPLTAEDVALAAAAVRAAQPHHPWHEGELLGEWRTADRMGRTRRLVLVREDGPAGWVSAGIWDSAQRGEGRLMVFVPGADRPGLDRAWALAEDAGRDLGVRLARAKVWEDDVATLDVVERRGWERRRRQRFWRLELTGRLDRLLGLRAAARRRVEAAGLRISTAADLGGEALYPELHLLDETTSLDIPQDVPHLPLPYDVWRDWMQPPGVLPERLWVATGGDRPVGMSYLDYRSTPVSTGYTGVLREHRGSGIARALKLETLVQAVGLGVEAVETDNDFENAPILHLNEQLGYGEIAGLLTLHKELSSA